MALNIHKYLLVSIALLLLVRPVPTLFPQTIEIKKKANKNHTKDPTVSASKDKQLVIKILKEAGVTDEEINKNLQEIPTWSQITNLYGSERIVLGTETCQHYRATVAKEKMVLALAGLFNTGTNAMATSLKGNIRNRFIAAQIPWWKHNFASRRYNYTHVYKGLSLRKNNGTATTTEKFSLDSFLYQNKTNNVLPIVMVKHPSTWMKSMCNTPYRLRWKHSGAHCPNLVEISRTNSSTVPVPVTLNGYDWQPTNPSLVHVWNKWNQEYVYYDKNDDFPRLIIRFEDYIFHNRKVLEEIARCVGSPIELNQTLNIKKETAKQSGTYSGLLQVIIKYGNTVGSNDPTNNMTHQDVEYYKEHLDKNLMKILHYQQM